MSARWIAVTRSRGSMPDNTDRASLGPIPLTAISRSNIDSSRAVTNPNNAIWSSRTWVWTRNETSDNIWYRFHLRATDSAGLSTEVTRDVLPRKVQVTLGTQPAGLALTLDGQPVTGGAFRRFGIVEGDETAELKRIWTDRRYRRRGYGRILLAELESRIAGLGYRRVYLTSGFSQPATEELYTASGYSRLSEQRPGGEVYAMAFEKLLN